MLVDGQLRGKADRICFKLAGQLPTTIVGGEGFDDKGDKV